MSDPERWAKAASLMKQYANSLKTCTSIVFLLASVLCLVLSAPWTTGTLSKYLAWKEAGFPSPDEVILAAESLFKAAALLVSGYVVMLTAIGFMLLREMKRSRKNT